MPQYPVPEYRPIRAGATIPCPVCEGARFINLADGSLRWTTGPYATTPGQRTCPLCEGSGVYTYKGV